MTLKERLNADFKEAMKNKEKVRKETISFVRAAIKQYEVDNREEIDDAGIASILAKQVKMRKDALADFESAGRTDLIGFDEKCLIRPRQFKKERIEETGKTNLKSRINRNGQKSGEHRNDRNSQGNHNNQKRQKKNGSNVQKQTTRPDGRVGKNTEASRKGKERGRKRR